MQFNAIVFRIVRPAALTLCLLIGTSALSASEFFASPQGTPQSTGSMSDPWDLQTALNQTSAIKPGDTLWLRGGTYVFPIVNGNNNGFNSNLKGTSASPIIVRNYQSEHVTLDGHGMYAVLDVYGSYTWFWGLELMDSNPAHVTQSDFAFGVGDYGPGNKFINLVVHDTSQGFSAYAASPDTEMYGNLVYYNGFINPEASGRVNFGHGMYLQNETGLKTVDDNIIFDNAVYGMQLYGSVQASLVGFRIDGNAVFNNSSWAGLTYGYNYIIANSGDRRDIQLTDNYSYFPLDATAGQNALGLYTQGQDISVTGSVFAGGYNPLEMQDQTGPVVFTGNTLYASQGLALVALDPGTASLSQYNWDHNAYYGNDVFMYPGGTGTFSQWQASTGLDAASTFSAARPSSNLIFVRPNRYESKRANIVIFNWTGVNAIAVDLSKVFTAGDSYVIQDAQNFYGHPVAEGVYTGGTVEVPLTSTAKSPMRGYPTPPHTTSDFQVFVALLAGSVSPPATQVIVSPQTVTVAENTSASFTAVVVGGSDPGVKWSVTPALGAVSANGVYTAPEKVLRPQTVTITATSTADASALASAIVTLLPPPSAVSGSPLVTAEGLGTLRNNYADWVGMEITISSIPLQVEGLGRWCVGGNTQVHALRIVDAATGADVGKTSVFMGGCKPGTFSYAPVPAGVTLWPGKSYYLVSQENWIGDQWYDFDTTVVTSDKASVIQAVYGNFTTVGAAGHSYGPVDLKFSIGGAERLHHPPSERLAK